MVVHHRGGHTSFYNSKAFEMAGVTKDTPNPPGGTFDRDAKGELNGRVTDRARGAVQQRRHAAARSPPAQTEQRERDGIAHISKQFVRYGLTSVHHEGGDLRRMQDVRARGELLHRVSYEASGRVLEAMIAGGIQTGFGDEWIKFGATSEHTVDGSFSERTMALSTPYPGVDAAVQGQRHRDAGRPQRVGRARASRRHPGELPRQRRRRDRHVSHRGRARAEAAAARRRAAEDHALHADQSDDLVRRIKAIGAVPALFTTYAYYNPDKFVFYGEETDEALHGVSLAARCRRPRGRRLGFQSGTVRAADGHPGHGDAQGLGRHRCGAPTSGSA